MTRSQLILKRCLVVDSNFEEFFDFNKKKFIEIH